MTEIKQKINLYLPRFQPEKLSKETKNLFFAISSAFAILVFIIASLMIINSLVDSEIVNNQQKSEVLNKKLEQAISKIPNVTADSNLVNRIKQQKSVIKKKQQVIAYLYKDTISEGENFTSLVDQLAQQNVQGIWLNKFEILNKGNDVQLFGYAKTPSQVSKYIEMLGAQNAYQGRNFQQIKINKSAQRWNDFYISTLSLKELLSLDAEEVE